jgi:hypothetical protein
MEDPSLFDGSDRGQEAVSHIMLFGVVIVLMASTSVIGGDLIESAQDSNAIDQSVRGFIQAHETAKQVMRVGSQDKYATSGIVSTVKLINAELHVQPDTEITINTDTSYTITTTPLKIDHDSFELYYDAGVITSLDENTTTTHWNPVNNQRSDDGVLRFTTTHINGSTSEVTGSTARLFYQQRTQPETVFLNDGDTITVETRTPGGWEHYLQQYDFLTITTTTEIGDATQITAEVDIDTNDRVLVHHQQTTVTFLD